MVRPEAVRASHANSKILRRADWRRGSYAAGVFKADARARVTALCDLFDDRIETGKQKIRAQDAAVYKDFEKLLASGIDAVIIASPPFEHPRMLEAAVQSTFIARSPWEWNVAGCRRVSVANCQIGLSAVVFEVLIPLPVCATALSYSFI
jgi:hypothetical protein